MNEAAKPPFLYVVDDAFTETEAEDTAMTRRKRRGPKTSPATSESPGQGQTKQ